MERVKCTFRFCLGLFRFTRFRLHGYIFPLFASCLFCWPNIFCVGFGSCMMETSFQFSVGCRQSINIPARYFPYIWSLPSPRMSASLFFFPFTASSRGVMMLASSSFFFLVLRSVSYVSGSFCRSSWRCGHRCHKRQDVVADNAGADPKLFSCDFIMAMTTW